MHDDDRHCVEDEPRDDVASLGVATDSEGMTPRRVARWAAVWIPTATVAIYVAVRSGVRHDYIAFSASWAATNRGDDPWGDDPYAYGPLFNALALPARLGELGPKIVFVLVWLSAAAVLVHIAGRISFRRSVLVYVLMVPNPLMFISVAVFGLFDIVVGVCALVAVILWRHRHPAASGVAIGAGVLLKLFPAVLVPVLFACTTRRALRSVAREWLSFTVALAATVSVGFGISALVWGSRSVTEPFTFGEERGAKLMSIFRYLGGRFSPIDRQSFDFDGLSVPLMVVALLAVSLWAWRHRVDPVFASTVAIVVAFTFYKVGHPQFVVVAMMFISYWIADHRVLAPRVVVACVAYSAWFGLGQAGYLVTALTHDSQAGYVAGWSWVRDLIGLPTFAVQLWLIVEMVRAGIVGGAVSRRSPDSIVPGRSNPELVTEAARQRTVS